MTEIINLRTFSLNQWHPFDILPDLELDLLYQSLKVENRKTGETIFDVGESVGFLYIIVSGTVDIISPEGTTVSQVSTGETFGYRAILRNGSSQLSAKSVESSEILKLPKQHFLELISKFPEFGSFFRQFERQIEPATDVANSLITATISDIMTRDPVTMSTSMSVQDAARLMDEHSISCVLVCENDQLVGMVTSRDLASRVIANGIQVNTPISKVMSRNLYTIQPNALVFDAMIEMSARMIGHVPIVEKGKPIGILTRTDLIRRRSVSAVYMISDIWRTSNVKEIAKKISNLPQLLAQLVGSGIDAYRIGQVITSVSDAVTKRFIQLAEETLGAPPVPYLWLACGSQGRQEQTGVSDQDNCIFIDDEFDEKLHGEYFRNLAKYVSDGLNTCGYYYCPGEMMATNPKWCQPVREWRKYFAAWIATPQPMAQMLASVMFDLRAIEGKKSLFEGLQAETLELSAKNSIFCAHMIANSLTHTPPLGLLRGFALIRSGEHKSTLDFKLSGVVPIIDIARIYALQGKIQPVNTRERLLIAKETDVLSEQGGNDLIDAYDLISDVRLEHQAKLVKEGKKPNNFVKPASLSALQRNYLRDAFGVVKTIQSALSYKSVR